MYLEDGRFINQDALYECSDDLNELIKIILECRENSVQHGVIVFDRNQLVCEGIMPHHVDVMRGDFILYNNGSKEYAFLVGPVIEDKFDLFLFGSRFHIDQTTGIEEIPAYVREELIATISGRW